MQVNELSRERLRELAGNPPGGKVLSLFFNLDPREFAAPPARETQVRSVLDRAAGIIRDDGGLDGDERKELLKDLERAQTELLGGLDGSRAHGLAVYVGGSGEYLEIVKLPHPLDHEPVVADGPFIEPIAALSDDERWCVLLVNRKIARLMCGTRDTLEESGVVEDDTAGQHSQGGWSQARFERSVERELEWHFDHAAQLAWDTLRDTLPDGLVLGGPSEVVAAFESHLHPYLRSRLVGRIDVDVEHATIDEVHAATASIVREHEEAHLESALDRLRLSLGRDDGRAVAGLGPVLSALNQRKVEILFADAGHHPPGKRCPQCGTILPGAVTSCPADGTETDALGDVMEAALESAIGQSADIRILRDRPDLSLHGHVAALLRF